MGAQPTLLLTGASGLVGSSLHRAAFAGWRCVLTTHARSAPSPLRRGDRAVQVDLAEPGAAARLAQSVEPQAIVHAAALASLAACEREPELARRVNVEATRELARAAAATGAYFVLLSTDQVFSGDRALDAGRPGYREDEAAAPITIYGRSKLDAELAAVAADPDALVLRTALVLGPSRDGRSGALDLVRGARDGEEVRLFVDEWRTPISVLDLARVVDAALERRASGILHVAGAERIDRFELGRRIAASFPPRPGERGPRLVAAEQREALPRRPRDVSLATLRLEREGWPRPRPLDVALGELRESSRRIQ